MFLSDLIAQARSVLPLFTDKFTTNVSATTISKTGDDVTVASVAHGLSVSDKFLEDGTRRLKSRPAHLISLKQNRSNAISILTKRVRNAF